MSNETSRGRFSWMPWRTVIVATVVAVCAATIVVPARATGTPTPPTSAQVAKYSGMAAALPTVMGAAPAGFQQQLQTYLQTVSSSQAGYSNLAGSASLASQAKAALPLLAQANAHDLAVLHYLLSYLNNWQQQPKQLVQVAHLEKVAKAWEAYHAAPAGSPLRKAILRAHAQFGSDCPSAAPIWLVVLLQGAKEVFDIVDEFVGDSDFIAVLGEGITLPISPYKIISSIVKIVLALAYDAAQGSYDVNNDCTEDEHEKQVDAHNQYSRAMNQQKTLTVHATALDSYHYQFSVQFEGQPVDPTNETLIALSLPTTCTTPPSTPGNCTSASDITSNIGGFQRLDTGLYQFTIPTNYSATAYRLKVEYDNGQDVNGNTLAYYGDVAFTKINQ